MAASGSLLLPRHACTGAFAPPGPIGASKAWSQGKQAFADLLNYAAMVDDGIIVGKLTNIREYIDTQALARASEMGASPRP